MKLKSGTVTKKLWGGILDRGMRLPSRLVSIVSEASRDTRITQVERLGIGAMLRVRRFICLDAHHVLSTTGDT